MNECPVCEKKIIPKFIEKYGEYTINHCPACDVVFSDPMKTAGAEWYEKSEMYVVGNILYTDITWWWHKQFLNDKVLYGQRLLDMGCGTGIFLNEARKKGYNVWGIDFNREQVSIAKKHYGLENVYIKSVEDILGEFSQKRFDIITFFEVLEHLNSPIQFIGQIKDILRPGGYIALSVPNRDCFMDTLHEADYPPHHLTRWNSAILSAFLERNGFEIIKCIVKKQDTKDVAEYLKGKFRFGIAKGMATRGIESKTQEDIRKAAKLVKTKNMIFNVLTLPLKPILSVISLPSRGLYVLARLKY